MDNTRIEAALREIGERVPPSSRIFLLGGCALTLLGSPRPTPDIDLMGDDVLPGEPDKAIIQAARELKVYAEAVPIGRFIPLPDGSEERSVRIGRFGNLEVFVADPYSIALSKPDRGFDTDMEDVLFLIQNNQVELNELERMAEKTLARAREFDINPTDFREHFETVRGLLK